MRRGVLVAVVGLLVACVLPAHPAAAALVAHYPLDAREDNGTTFDASGSGLHGNEDLTNVVAGRFGNAFDFLTASSQVALPVSAAFDLQRLSVLAWVRRAASPGTYRYVFAKGAQACEGSSYAVYTGATGGLRFYVRGGDGTVVLSPDAGPAIWDDAWHAVAGTYDGTRARLFVDGRQVGDGTAGAVTIEHHLSTSTTPTIGRYPSGGCNPANSDGAIDDVRIYDSALSEAEIRAAQGFPADPVTPPPAPPAGPPPPGGATEAPYVPARAAFTPSATRLRAGSSLRLDASASLPPGAVAREFAWNLDADAEPEARCDPETPVLELNVARAGTMTPRLTVTDERGAVTTAAMPLTVTARPTLARSAQGPRLRRVLTRLERRVARAEPAVTCRPVSTGAVRGLDVTALGGPRAGCVAKTEIYAALVSAVGCLRQVDSWDEVPAAERGIVKKIVAARFSLPQALFATAHAAQIQRIADQAAWQDFIADSLWVADGPVRVNGLDYTPSPGASIVIVRPGLMSEETPVLLSSRVTVSAPTDIPREVVLRPAGDLRLPLNKAGMEVARIPISAGVPFIPGTRVRGAVRTALERNRSRILVRLQLPDDFRWGSGGPVVVDAEMLASNRDGIRLDGFGVSDVDASIAGVGVHLRYLRYVSSQRRFEGSAVVRFQPLGQIDGTLHVRGERIELLNVTYLPGAPGIKVAPGVFLSEVNAFYENSPSVVHFGGNAAFTGGPAAGNGCGLVGVRGGFDFRVEPEPVTVTIEGTGSVVCLPLFRAKAILAADGYVSVDAGIDYKLGPLGLRAGWSIRYFDLRFTAEAGARGCIGDIGCIGGTALVSDKGLAFCGDFGWFDAGAGLDWPPGPSIPAILARLDVMFPSCDVGPWRTVRPRAHAAQAAGPLTVQVPAGGRGIVTGVVGTERAPRLRLRGPAGQVIEMPASGAVRTDRVVAFRTEEVRTTFVALRDPGTWTVEVLDGTTVADVRRAAIEPDPVVRGTVSRAGGRLALRYEIGHVDGQVVRFFERAPGGMREIGRARGARGVVRFTPSEARGSAREIVALVERDGMPREQIRVARFTAAPPRIGRPRAVHARRSGGVLRVTFRGAANAESHLVGVEVSDGRSLQLVARRGARGVRVPRVARGARVTIRIAGRRGARQGPVVIARRVA